MRSKRRNRPGYVYMIPMHEDRVIGRRAHAVVDDADGRSIPALCSIEPVEARWVRKIPLPLPRCPACASLLHQIIGVAGGRVRAVIHREQPRSLKEVAAEIERLWPPPRRRVERSLRVMKHVDLLEESYDGMTGLQAVEEFLDKHWHVWRGTVTHGVKKELKMLMKLGHRRLRDGE